MEGIAETSTASTPVSTPETTTAAPATTETTSGSSTSQRPTNVRELAAFMEKSATTQSDPAASSETAATRQAAPTDPTGVQAQTGPVPFTVHKTALDNARTKAATEAVAKYREQFGWAEKVPQAQLQEFSALASRMSTDPVGFATAFMQELQQHPTYGPQLRSHAGRMLATRSAAVDAEPKPDRQIVDDSGRVIGQTFADGGAAHAAWLKRQIQAEFAPIKAERDQRIASEKAAEIARQVESAADSMLEEVDQILDGAYSKKDNAIVHEVNKLMEANPSWSVHRAALKVREMRIVPALQGKAQQQVVDTFNKKAAGNTANGTGTPATPQRPRNATELAAWMAANFR